MPLSPTSLAILVSGLILLPLHADWLQFRGPNASSRGTGQPPAALTPADIAWKAPLPGRGLSSPVITGGKVFLTAASGPDQETLHVLCFDQATGSRLWERRFQSTGRTMCHEKTSVAAPSPASDGTRLFALFSTNDLFCLDLDGNLLWLRGFTYDYPNASNSLGLASSPILADGALITQIENDSDSFTAAIDPLTGANLWKIARPKNANWTSPTAWQDPGTGRSLVLITSHEGVIALDPKSGKEQWTLPKPGTTIPSSAISPGHLAVPRPGKGLAAYSLTGGTTPPRLLWESPQINADTASPLIQGDQVFALNGAGVLTCADLATGDRPWKLRMEGPFSGSPVIAGSTLYAASERGILQSVDTTAAEGAVTGKIELGETVLCTPSLSGNALYLRSDKTLWCVGNPAANP